MSDIRSNTTEKLDSTLFLNTRDKNGCKASDGKCFLHDSVIVWNPNDIIYNCPFEIIDILTFKIENNNLLQGVNNTLLFEITGKENDCNENLVTFLTTEGIHLHLQFENSTAIESFNLQKSMSQFKTTYSIILAEEDQFKKKAYEAHRELNLRACYAFLYNNMASISFVKNELNVIQDYNGNEIVLFTDRGQIFIANCENVRNVSIITYTSSCYRDIPVTYQKKNNIVLNGFMNRDRIIRQIGESLECNKLSRKLIILNSTNFIIKEKNITYIENNDNFERTKITAMTDDLEKEN